MLRGTLAFVVLVACALVGWEVRRWLGRRGVVAPSLEGLSFVAAGVVLGPAGLGLFAPDVLRQLRPVVLLGLAWIGLLVGLQADLTVIRRLAPWHRRAGLLLPLVPGALVGGAALGLGAAPLLAAAAACIAMVSSPGTLAALGRAGRPRDRAAVRLLRLVMSFSSLPALLGFGVAVLLLGPEPVLGPGIVDRSQALVVAVGLGVLLGYAVIVLLRGERLGIHILTMLTGVMALLAGAAEMVGATPLLLALLAGAVVMGRCAFPHRILQTAHGLETPMLVALLVLVGAAWRWVGISWPALLVVTVVRAAGCAAAGAVLARAAGRRGARLSVAAVGLGLLPQGPVAMGILVGALTVAPLPPGVLTAVLAGLALNELAGHAWTRRTLVSARARSVESQAADP